MTKSTLKIFPCSYHFNPHSHAGSDGKINDGVADAFYFNPHSHAGSDFQSHFNSRSSYEISIHTPTQGVTKCIPVVTWSDSISIHTPTQGVTQFVYETSILKPISIHTPTQGVTVLLFQHHHQLDISIHTPTQGVTYSSFFLPDKIMSFQSTLPRREWRIIYWNKKEAIVYFNPHSHAGSDSQSSSTPPSVLYFNPHSHAGSDLLLEVLFVLLRQISIHTPTQGVTLKVSPSISITKVFQSTLPRREWHGEYMWIIRAVQISIHTPTQGVTLWVRGLWSLQSYFNPHSHAGSDPALPKSYAKYIVFQSTLPRREWRRNMTI